MPISTADGMETSTDQSSRTVPRPQVHRTQALIDGQWTDSADGQTFETSHPATEEVIAEVAQCGPADVDRAVKAARKAFEEGEWKQMDARDRGRLLYALADRMEDHFEELAALETLDNGKSINDSRGDLNLVLDCLRYYAGWADKLHGDTVPVRGDYFTYTRREPVGVCGQIIPWNFPMLMVAWKWGPALAVGCTIVMKPAEQTPLTCLRMADLAMEVGFPPGVINVVPGFGDTGAALVDHPDVDKIAFTGSTETGQLIMKQCANTLKRVTLELGGKSPNIVFADADLDAAVLGADVGLFLNQGQCCCAGSRLFVEESIHEEFVGRIVERAKTRPLGDPFSEDTVQGPQIDQTQFDKIMDYIDRGQSQGAKLLAGGERHGDRGYFVQPTVFDQVSDDMDIARDEIFGPVMSILPFRDVDEVVERGNRTLYGLAAAVWTRDGAKAHKVAHALRAGTVWINCYDVFDAGASFGGFKQSGIGRELGEAALRNYTEHKTITMALS